MGEIDVNKTTVEFIGEHAARNCYTVQHYMEAHGMDFQHVVDYLELRLGYHFVIVDEDLDKTNGY